MPLTLCTTCKCGIFCPAQRLLSAPCCCAGPGGAARGQRHARGLHRQEAAQCSCCGRPACLADGARQLRPHHRWRQVLGQAQGLGPPRTHRYRFSVEWHMQLMQWLPGKWSATESSSAAWYSLPTEGPPPSALPARPMPAWQSTLTPVMPAQPATFLRSMLDDHGPRMPLSPRGSRRAGLSTQRCWFPGRQHPCLPGECLPGSPSWRA